MRNCSYAYSTLVIKDKVSMFNPQKYRSKNCLIIGAGKSGLSCADLLMEMTNSKITVYDKKSLRLKNFKSVSDENFKEIIDTIDFAVKSPGISNNNPIINEIIKHKIPIFSEVEIALSFSKTKNIVMITGTNGKSTTTYLTYKIFNNYLKKHNAKAVLAGNIGKPVSAQVLKADKNDWIIIEISSYQLEDSTYLKPKIAAILNITPDHIEHHGSMEKYIEAKFKIFKYMDKNGYLIINNSDDILKKIKPRNTNILRFSIKNDKNEAYYDGKNIILLKYNSELRPAKIQGEHNIENEMAASLMASSAKISYDIIQQTLDKFKGLEHRIEFVREINGVSYINDSKGTNVDSTLIALKALGKEKNIWLILGGTHKNAPYAPLKPYIKKYVKKIMTIGEAAPIIEKELKGTTDIITANTIGNALKFARKEAAVGDIVLLSPACASFDQFKNFEDRGRKFKKIVKSL
ncbi:MAG: UDP-N-acetylmuramoyl-L-alanine--D-glutamate ligase [Elusimicrobia bacterium]|nr:UDP-N-acetylmuramoyl-L-alanine--D-glutamate ligase [Elusimicrobiota bacterium]